jgi:opacity protein-like surface antigen
MFASHRPWHVKFILLLALVLALLVAVPVFADPPVIDTGSYDNDYVQAPEFQVCPGIDLWDHIVATWRQTTYFDKAGNVTSIKIHFTGTDTFHNPAKPGFELRGKFSATLGVDLQTGEFTSARGLAAHIIIPGHGTALVESGFWSRYPTIHEAGKDSFNDPDDLAAFCSYLASN